MRLARILSDDHTSTVGNPDLVTQALRDFLNAAVSRQALVSR